MDRTCEHYKMMAAILYEYRKNHGITQAHTNLAAVFPDLEFRFLESWFTKFAEGDFDLSKEVIPDESRNLIDMPDHILNKILINLDAEERMKMRRVNKLMRDTQDFSPTRTLFDKFYIREVKRGVELTFFSANESRNLYYKELEPTKTRVTVNDRYPKIVHHNSMELASAYLMLESTHPKLAVAKLEYYGLTTKSDEMVNKLSEMIMARSVPIRSKILEIEVRSYMSLLTILNVTLDVEEIRLVVKILDEKEECDDATIKSIIDHPKWKHVQSLKSTGESFCIPLAACGHIKKFRAYYVAATEEEYKEHKMMMRRINRKNFKMEYEKRISENILRYVTIEQFGPS